MPRIIYIAGSIIWGIGILKDIFMDLPDTYLVEMYKDSDNDDVEVGGGNGGRDLDCDRENKQIHQSHIGKG